MKSRKYIVYISLILLLIILSGCKNNNSQLSDTLKYTIKNKEYTDNFNNEINIAYPFLENNKQAYNFANQIIEDTVNKEVASYDKSIGIINCSIDYEITYQSNELISIVFKGYFNEKSTAHPLNRFFTLNIDLKSKKQVSINDVYLINKEFIKTYKACVKKQADENISNYLNSYKDDELEMFIKNENNLDTYFLNENQIGISVPVPHAIGDHFEAYIDYSELKIFELDGNPLHMK